MAFRMILAICLVTVMLAANSVFADDRDSNPNVIIIFTDDQGYADLSCFGSENIKTPHIDRMAKEGCKFTNFMVASPVCTPSRAALLTGSYPKRVGLHKHVLFPDSTTGLHPDEYTIADIMIWPWYGALVLNIVYEAAEFLDAASYKNLNRWAQEISEREAVQRGRMVNRFWGPPEGQLHERH